MGKLPIFHQNSQQRPRTCKLWAVFGSFRAHKTTFKFFFLTGGFLDLVRLQRIAFTFVRVRLYVPLVFRILQFPYFMERPSHCNGLIDNLHFHFKLAVFPPISLQNGWISTFVLWCQMLASQIGCLRIFIATPPPGPMKNTPKSTRSGEIFFTVLILHCNVFLLRNQNISSKIERQISMTWTF